MSSIHKELEQLAESIGAPVVGKNASEQIRAITVHLGGTSHGANISDRIEELKKVWSTGGGEHAGKFVAEMPGLYESVYGSYVYNDVFVSYYSTTSYNTSTTLANLKLEDEAEIEANMSSGSSSKAGYYNSTDKIGAFAGRYWVNPQDLDHVNLYMGRPSTQKVTLNVVVQACDMYGKWEDIETVSISQDTPYPNNVFTIPMPKDPVYGVRWYHRDEPKRTSNSNIYFFGMTYHKKGEE